MEGDRRYAAGRETLTATRDLLGRLAVLRTRPPRASAVRAEVVAAAPAPGGACVLCVRRAASSSDDRSVLALGDEVSCRLAGPDGPGALPEAIAAARFVVDDDAVGIPLRALAVAATDAFFFARLGRRVLVFGRSASKTAPCAVLMVGAGVSLSASDPGLVAAATEDGVAVCAGTRPGRPRISPKFRRDVQEHARLRNLRTTKLHHEGTVKFGYRPQVAVFDAPDASLVEDH